MGEGEKQERYLRRLKDVRNKSAKGLWLGSKDRPTVFARGVGKRLPGQRPARANRGASSSFDLSFAAHLTIEVEKASRWLSPEALGRGRKWALGSSAAPVSKCSN